ncbi:MAG: homoaconitate hydratase [Candidatus Lokiarchaeota archaeon]|nr:homoaconitate hydratase [Candidatus Lokiarchaeota archaeon]
MRENKSIIEKINEIKEGRKLLHNYNELKENIPPRMVKKIEIWDETLRDGEQTPGVNLSLEQKIDMIKIMDDMGIAVIVVGYPAVSDKDKSVVSNIARENFDAKIAAPARAHPDDIDVAIDCEVDEIPVFYPISDLSLKMVLKIEKEKALQKIEKSIQYIKDHGIAADFVPVDASRTPLNNLLDFCEVAINAGAEKIDIADTVGYLRPQSTKFLFNKIITSKRISSDTIISPHCHNDFGLATANTLAALEEGANYPHVTVNAFGERSGNAALEEVVLALDCLYGIETIKTDRLYELAEVTEAYFGLPLSVHKAVVGVNSFSHESGLHIHAMVSGGPWAIEPYNPRKIGRKRYFYMGKYSGRTTIKYLLDQANIDATEEQVQKILEEVKSEPSKTTRKEAIKTMKMIKNKIRESYRGIRPAKFWDIVEKVTGEKAKDPYLMDKPVEL